MNHFGMALAAVVTVAQIACAQVTITGPEMGEAGEPVTLSVQFENVRDPRIEVFKDGRPIQTGWTAVKGWDDKPIINFTTRFSGVYTTVIAANRENVTYVARHVLQIGKPEPVVPKPDPVVPNSDFTSEIRRLYAYQADVVALIELIDIFERLKSRIGDVKSYGNLEQIIVNSAKVKLQDNQLRKVRDRIGDLLVEKTGGDPRVWNKQSAEQMIDTILTALRSCKNG